MGSGGGDLEGALRRLADGLRADTPALIERELAQARRDLPELSARDEDPEAVELHRESSRAGVAVICDALASARDPRPEDVPAAAAAEVRASLRLGVRLGPILLGHRVAQRLLFQEATARVRADVADPELREEVLAAAAARLLAYFDILTARMAEVHDRERELLLRDRERRKRARVHDLLEGRPVDVAALGYPIEGDHLGLVAWGTEPERALLALGAATGRPVLVVGGTESSAWGWLAAAALDADAMRAVAAIVEDGRLRLALGDAGQGEEGFRQTHRQALEACRIAREGEPRAVTWYADVALLALTLHDRDAARAFVLRELGTLAERNPRNALLRETLSAYFATGQNATAAAAALGVNDRTARYRIKAIEERLGRSILERRDELGVALRLAEVVLREEGEGA